MKLKIIFKTNFLSSLIKIDLIFILLMLSFDINYILYIQIIVVKVEYLNYYCYIKIILNLPFVLQKKHDFIYYF